MYRLLIILILFQFKTVLARNPATFRERQLFTVNYSHLWFKNKQDVEILSGKKDFLTAYNTSGYMLGIGYQYTNKRNIVFSANAFYGIQKHNLLWDFKLNDFDPNINLAARDTVHRFAATNQYLALIGMAGYQIPLLKKLNLQIKVGVGNLSRFGQTKESWVHRVFYSYEPGVYNLKQFAYTDADAGTEGKWFSDRAPFYCFNISGSIKIKSRSIQSLGVGLQYIQIMAKNGINSARSFYYNSSGIEDGIQAYNNRFRSIGLTISLGF